MKKFFLNAMVLVIAMFCFESAQAKECSIQLLFEKNAIYGKDSNGSVSSMAGVVGSVEESIYILKGLLKSEICTSVTAGSCRVEKATFSNKYYITSDRGYNVTGLLLSTEYASHLMTLLKDVGVCK